MRKNTNVQVTLSKDAYGRVYDNIYTSDGRKASLYDATFTLYSRYTGQLETITYSMVKIADTTDLKKYWYARICSDYADYLFVMSPIYHYFS